MESAARPRRLRASNPTAQRGMGTPRTQDLDRLSVQENSRIPVGQFCVDINKLQQDTLDEVRQQVELDVWNSYQALRSATLTLEQSQTLLDLAGHSYSAAQKRYKIGVGNILELLNAQSALANAKKQRIQSLTDWRSARLQLAGKLGELGIWRLDRSEQSETNSIRTRRWTKTSPQ